MVRIARIVPPSATERPQFVRTRDHKPTGNDSDLESAMQLLSISPSGRDEAKRKIVVEVSRFLEYHNSNSPRIAEDLERLEKAEKLSRSLDATLISLSRYSFNIVGQFLPKAGFSGAQSPGDAWFMIEYLSVISRAAKAARMHTLEVFGKDKGGKGVTVDTLTVGNPYTWKEPHRTLWRGKWSGHGHFYDDEEDWRML